MTWFKVDDSFYDHPKAFDAPDSAVALWTRAGTWSARNLTDGFVPSKLPARLCDDPDTAVRELLTRGLWTKARGGYQFHEWADYQPTKAQVKDLRAKRAEAGKRGGEKSRPASTKQTGSNSEASASGVAKQNGTPARPGPSFMGHLGEGESPPARTREIPPPQGNFNQGRPSERCTKHVDVDDPPPCGHCADARRAAEQFDAERQAQRKQAAEQLEQATRDRRFDCEHGTPAGAFVRVDGTLHCPQCRRKQQEPA